MGVSVGIVGLPNVGKSTVFNALTGGGAEAANYPFCTIDPNVGIVPVPDPRLDRIHAHITTDKVIPTVVELVDVAGLVKGASKGEGRGNQFLANIRETHAVLMMVRCFDDDNITHVEGAVDPARDIDIITTELVLADYETLEKRLKKAQSAAKSGQKEAKDELAAVEKMIEHIGAGKPARTCELSEAQRESLKHLHLITEKPMLYACNIGEDDLPGGNAYTEQVEKIAKEQGAQVVMVCGKLEEELVALPPEDRKELLDSYGLKEPALNQLVRACYKLLGLQSYFTAGEKEIRAWTIKIGDLAPQAAGVIHSDFERGFIRAQVYTIEDLEEYGSEAAIKAAGKMRVEGKDYVVADGDIVHFLFNV